jgi:hypothetical protein
MATGQESFNRIAHGSTKFLPLLVFRPAPKRRTGIDNTLLFLVLCLASAESLKSFVVAVNYGKTVSCFT